MRPRTAQNTGRPPRPFRSSTPYRDDDEYTVDTRSDGSGTYTNSSGYGTESNFEDYGDTDASGWMCLGMCGDDVNNKIEETKISDDTFDGENTTNDEIIPDRQRQENVEELVGDEENPQAKKLPTEKKDIEEFLKKMIDDIDVITVGDETLGDESLLTAETGINYDEETDYSVLRRIMYSGLCRIWPTQLSDECIPIVSRDMMEIIDELDDSAGDVTKEKVLLYLTQEADNKKADETYGPLAIKNVPEEEEEEEKEQEEAEESTLDSDKAKTPNETPEIFEGFEAQDISYEKNRGMINNEENLRAKTDGDDEDSISDSSTLGEIERMRDEHKERCLASMVSWEDDDYLPHSPTNPILDDDAKTLIDTSLPDLKSTSVETSVEDCMNDLIISSDYKKLYSDDGPQEGVIDMTPIKKHEEDDGCISSNRLAELMAQLDRANSAFNESMKVVNGQLTPKNVTPVKPRTTTDIMKDRARWEETLRDVQRRKDCRIVNN